MDENKQNMYVTNVRICRYMLMVFEVGMILSIFAMLKPLAIIFAASLLVIRVYQMFTIDKLGRKLGHDKAREVLDSDDFSQAAELGEQVIGGKYPFTKYLLVAEGITVMLTALVTVFWIGILPIIFAAIDAFITVLFYIVIIKSAIDIKKGRF